MKRHAFPASLAALALVVGSCAAPLNYTNLDGPRYTGCGDKDTVSWHPRTGEAAPGAPPMWPAEGVADSAVAPPGILVASFNIKFAVEMERAVDLLESVPELRAADVLLLQEMDVAGVRKVAEALDYCWVYYPATLHPQSGRQFGNAVLSRYPIRQDHKVTLPHIGQFGRTQRLATAATIDVNGTLIRLYSMHLATIVELGPERRRRQARAIVEDAAQFDGPVLVGGDLNARSLGDIFVEAGYDWLTRDIGRTTRFASLDHFLVKGLKPAAGVAVRKLIDSAGASDHVPVWVRVVVE